ncbi:uncharacterized protein LOC104906806 [Beta vulgaris subsp. vulgaris]|uniref:uncharacterized protein LOC104906806 n=1 Tax=Beta vulgaris subsp. vulgaris TaxID=3555 RepID=UPI00053F714D|nr:uncharacterized protein LOC104906806 [Beta vulgaris subsp. vulgaris]
MSCLFSCCASLACGCCTSVASGITNKSARIAYCGLFGASLVVSWILREVASPLLEKFPWINNADHTKEWYQTSTVLRVSLGNFLFFAVLALIMIGVKDQNDKRDSWHHGGWMVKMIIWILLIVLMFFMPNVVVDIYGILSKFGAGLFLLVQVVLLLDFTYTWNDAWVEKDEQKWYVALLAVSVGCYIAAFAFSGILFIWFNPSGQDCGLNVFFIVMTMILAFAFAVIALHPKVNGSLLPASVISVYCAYVCYTGLSSEPRDYVCNGLHNKSKAVTTSTLVLGMITTVLSVLYSALRAGSSKAFLSPPSSPRAGATKSLLSSEDTEAGRDKKDSEPRPVSYSYMFFHLIFALASMYSAMLLSGWTSSTDNSDLIDIGWASVWVKICTEWVTAGLYVWSLVAPLLLPDREFY